MLREFSPYTLALLAVLPLAVGALGCQSPETSPALFGGLDTDQDGVFRPADLEPGTAGIYLWRSNVDEEAIEEAHRSLDAQLFFNTEAGNWVFRAPLLGAPEYVLHMAFDPESGGQGPALGASELLGVSIDVPAREHGGSADPGGEFNITEAGETASGWAELDTVVAMDSYVQQVATGEEIRVAGIAFSSIEVIP